MFWNYLKTSIRNLNRLRLISLINILGLATSLCITLLLIKFIQHETSYDTFHANADRVYRVITNVNLPNGKNMLAPLTVGTLPTKLTSELPEVMAAIKLDHIDDKVTVDGRKMYGFNNIIVDSTFFNIFTFPAFEGDALRCIRKPQCAAITQDAAKKLFGSESAMGRSILIGDKPYTIEAVLKNIPSNSHLKFDIVTSFSNINNAEEYINNRGVSFPVYFLLKSPIKSKETENKIIACINQQLDKRLAKTGIKAIASIQPLKRIHLYSKGFMYDVDGTGSLTQIIIFSFISLLIFAIAVINFINLIIARSETRQREIIIRKISGSSKLQLITQFLGESILLTTIAMLLAVALAENLLPAFSNIVERDLPQTFLTASFLVELIGLSLLTGVLAGIYPAIYISRFETFRGLKREVKKGQSLSTLQVSLVIIQFSITIFLLISVISLSRQIHFMKEKNLGFNKEVYVISALTPKIEKGFQSIKGEIESIPGVNSVAASESIPGNQSTMQNGYKEGDNPNNAILIQENRVQNGYLSTMQIPVIEGRDFDADLSSDSASFILNKAAVSALGLKNPIGEWIHVWQKKGKVIGITDDYHFQSLHRKIEPLVISKYSSSIRYILVNLDTKNVNKTLKAIEEVMQRYDQSYSFLGKFVNDYFNGEYRKEEKLEKIIIGSSILTILIALMGLFALTYFTINRKTKEIGIRKVLGSTRTKLGVLMIWNITRWVLLANLIAWPLSYFTINTYFNNFAYKVDHSLWVFLIAGLITFLVAFLTIIAHILKVTAQNPVISLRYE